MIPPYFAISVLPLVVLLLCLLVCPRIAICVAVIGSYLYFPGDTGINLPLLPAFNKLTIPGLVAFLVLAIRYRDSLRTTMGHATHFTGVLPGWIPKSTVGKVLLAVIVTSPFLTVLTNMDTVVVGRTVLRALRPHDAVAGVATTLVALLPLLLARKFLSTEEGHRTLLIVLAVMGFVYSFLAAYEIRMSPQLNMYVYGWRGSAWRQHLRADGFRPFVFMHHGLWLGIFLSCAILACITLFRSLSEGTQKTKFLLMGLWTLLVLALAKTFGAFLITLLIFPVVLFLSTRVQLLVAAILAGIVLIYPVLRGANIVPVDAVVAKVATIEAERAASLQYRLNNEDIMLDKANQRPLFGWGGWSRSRVYDENGRDISTTDGRWVIVVGESGWYGYLGTFGLMALPILTLAMRRKQYEVSLATSGLCLVLVANMIDLIPNGTLTMVTWLIAGALLGRLEVGRATEDAQTNEGPPDPVVSPQLAYTRFQHKPPQTRGAKT